MDGGTVNCSSNTPDAVREGTDELGGCSDIPQGKQQPRTLCVCICVSYVLVCVCEHV